MNKVTLNSDKNLNHKDFPLTWDELLEKDNIPAKADPPDFDDRLKPEHIFSVNEKQGMPEVAVERHCHGWAMQLPKNATAGLIGQQGQKVTSKPNKKEFRSKPERPKGSDLVFHPPVGGLSHSGITKRKNGNLYHWHDDGVIFNGESRQPFNPKTFYPWRCIGKLLIWDDPNAIYKFDPADWATAALVGPNMIVTASHAIPWGKKRFKALFLAGFYDGETTWNKWSYVETYRGYVPVDQGNDIAIMKLYTPIGASLGWFGAKAYNDDWEGGNYWTKVGYAGMIAGGKRPNRIVNFPIVDDDNSGYGLELEHKADSSSGDSGGPVFGFWNDGPYIVGITSGGEYEYGIPPFGGFNGFFGQWNNIASGGGILPDLVRWGHKNWGG